MQLKIQHRSMWLVVPEELTCAPLPGLQAVVALRSSASRDSASLSLPSQPRSLRALGNVPHHLCYLLQHCTSFHDFSNNHVGPASFTLLG